MFVKQKISLYKIITILCISLIATLFFSSCAPEAVEEVAQEVEEVTEEVEEVTEEVGWTYGIANLSFTHPFHRDWLHIQPEDVDPDYGCTSIFKNSEFDMQQQLADIDSFIQMGVDVLHINPIDVVAVEPGVQKALDAGIPTVTGSNKVAVDGNINALDDAYNCISNISRMIAASLNYEGKVCFVAGQVGNFAGDQRLAAFLDTMEEFENIEVLDWQPSDWLPEKAVTIVENWLNKYDQIDAIGVADSSLALPVIELLKSYGREDIIVSGYAAADEAIESMKVGEIDFDVLVSPDIYAWYTTQVAYLVYRGVDLPTDVFIETPIVMTSETAELVEANGMDLSGINWITPQEVSNFGPKIREKYSKASTDAEYGLK